MPPPQLSASSKNALRSDSPVWMKLSAGLFLSALSALPAVAAHSSWSGDGGDAFWSTAGNWTPGGVPLTSGTVTFTNVGSSADSVTVGNVVASSTTLRTLIYSNTNTTAQPAVWQVTKIEGADTVLALTSGLTVGGFNANVRTNAAITGDGTLSVTGGAINIFNTQADGANAGARTELDLSGLAAFNATVSTLRVGYGQGSLGIFTLAHGANTISADSITVGDNNTATYYGTAPSELNFGLVNEIKTDNIYVGARSNTTQTNTQRNSGLLRFQSGVEGLGAILTIGGRTGEKANLTLGSTGSANTSTGPVSGIADFTDTQTAGKIALTLGELKIGFGKGTKVTVTGVLKWSDGDVTADTLVMGWAVSGSNTASVTSGTFSMAQVEGGTSSFTVGSMDLAQSSAYNATSTMRVKAFVDISGGKGEVTGVVDGTSDAIVMGRYTGAGTTVGLSEAVINLSGGSLKVSGGDITEGVGGNTVTSTINLIGGSLDMVGNKITVDTFNIQSGEIANLGEFNSGATLTKTTAGLLKIKGVNAYTGVLQVNEGAAQVDGSTVSGVNLASSTALSGTGTVGGAVNLVGSGTLSSSGTLHLSSALNVSGVANTLASGVIAVGGTTTINSGAVLSVNGTLGGAGALVIDGTLNGSGIVNKTGGSISGSGLINNAVTLSGGVELGTATLGSSLTVGGTGNFLGGGKTASVTGVTTIDSGGSFEVDGTLSGAGGLVVNGVLSGGGVVDKTLSGSGSINPGNSPGLLTAASINPEDGLDFNFEFTLKNAVPTWGSENDALRVTGATPFALSLTSSNVISLYLSAALHDSLEDGDFLIGGFYADNGGEFSELLANATVQIYFQQDGGGITYNDASYSLLTGGGFNLSTISDPSLSPNGFVTQFTYQAVPEPQTAALFILAGGAMLWRGRRRFSAKISS